MNCKQTIHFFCHIRSQASFPKENLKDCILQSNHLSTLNSHVVLINFYHIKETVLTFHTVDGICTSIRKAKLESKQRLAGWLPSVAYMIIDSVPSKAHPDISLFSSH